MVTVWIISALHCRLFGVGHLFAGLPALLLRSVGHADVWLYEDSVCQQQGGNNISMTISPGGCKPVRYPIA